MGTATSPAPVKPIIGLLASSTELLADATSTVSEQFGPVDAASTVSPWCLSTYYQDEMGPAIVRQFLSVEQLIAPGKLAGMKQITNQMESRWQTGAGRRVNIDPGYVALCKLVLATTKDAAHRVYLSGGVYAEVTLHFHGGSFAAYSYTYPDYAAPDTIGFFNAVRATYLAQLRDRSM